MSESMTAADYQRANYKAMKERDFQEQVRRVATANNWLFYHTHNSRYSPAGFPDCVILRPPDYRGWSPLIVAELKREGQQPTPIQQEWLDAFRATFGVLADADDYVIVECWRPSDIRRIEALLQGDADWRTA